MGLVWLSVIGWLLGVYFDEGLCLYGLDILMKFSGFLVMRFRFEFIVVLTCGFMLLAWILVGGL